MVTYLTLLVKQILYCVLFMCYAYITNFFCCVFQFTLLCLPFFLDFSTLYFDIPPESPTKIRCELFIFYY